MLKELELRLKQESNTQKAKLLQKFFKTGKGEYGEGDIFLGIIVPVQRRIANEFKELDIGLIHKLLNSRVHEKRLIALLILIKQFEKADKTLKKYIFDFYLKNTKNTNNWDLVDLSAPNIIGNYLMDKDRKILYELANSSYLWEKRIAIISTFAFIRKNDFDDAIKISEILLYDKHDLIHKAVGWMLRELGKRNKKILEDFLKKHYKKMPRTMLRYSIEKFDENERKMWLNGEKK